MARLVIRVVGMMLLVGGICAAFGGERAFAETSCWQNVKTGRTVPEGALVPNGARMDSADPRHAYAAPVKAGHPDIIPDFPGVTYVRNRDGKWINAGTGAPVPDSALVPNGARMDSADTRHAYAAPVKAGHPDIIPDFPGVTYVRVPCPPTHEPANANSPTKPVPPPQTAPLVQPYLFKPDRSAN